MRATIGSVLVLLAAAVGGVAAAAPQAAGMEVTRPHEAVRYTGALGPAADDLPLVLTVERDRVSADFPTLGQAGYEGTMTRAAEGAVTVAVETPAGPMKLDGREVAGVLEGTWRFLGREGPFRLTGTTHSAPQWGEEGVTFTGADGVRLSGVVLTPLTGSGRRPAFVGVHGSGVETRAGANRFLAERLVAEGAVVLLFDKRGTGKSEGDWRPATLQQLAGDVAAGVDLLAKRADVDPNRLGLLGPSQAGWVASIVAAERPCLAYLMIRSGVLTGVAEEGRYDYLQRLHGYPEDVQARAARILELDDEVTRSGQGWSALQAEIAAVAEQPWFKAMKFKVAAAHAPARAQYRSWLDFDPRPLLAKSRASGQWIYAGGDETVPAARSAEIARALATEGHDFEVLTIPEASHALYLAPASGRSWPQVAPQYLDASLDWYRRHVKTAQAPACPR